jgi:subtilisin family serine protease
MLESARTVGMPATGKAVIAVASHVSKNQWPSDQGQQEDVSAVVGRTSSFSSRGPSRDGASKPEISAPGQYLTAALAAGSELEALTGRVDTPKRLLTIEGTSMASPFVAGVVSLLLEATPTLTPAQARTELQAHGVKDAHTGPLAWTPEYGFGKISAAALIGAPAVPGVIATAAARGGARRPVARKTRQPA